MPLFVTGLKNTDFGCRARLKNQVFSSGIRLASDPCYRRDRPRLARKGDAMRCERCSGLMVPDLFFDMLDDSGNHSFVGWRCVSCGDVLDPVIQKNRHALRSPLVHLS